MLVTRYSTSKNVNFHRSVENPNDKQAHLWFEEAPQALCFYLNRAQWWVTEQGNCKFKQFYSMIRKMFKAQALPFPYRFKDFNRYYRRNKDEGLYLLLDAPRIVSLQLYTCNGFHIDVSSTFLKLSVHKTMEILLKKPKTVSSTWSTVGKV